MNDNFNLINALQDEWNAVSESPSYREALVRWQAVEPALAGFESPAEVVAWCWGQAVPKEANRPVGALLRLAAAWESEGTRRRAVTARPAMSRPPRPEPARAGAPAAPSVLT